MKLQIFYKIWEFRTKNLPRIEHQQILSTPLRTFNYQVYISSSCRSRIATQVEIKLATPMVDSHSCFVKLIILIIIEFVVVKHKC